jgi:phage/plasmid-like protein (TIGR03299 family)
MAHLIESMAYVDAMPWHGLGNKLTANQPIEVWAQQSGLAFEIKEAPVRFMSESIGSLGTIMSFPEQKVLYRSDTKAPLSVVSERYKVVQPREILEFYRDLTEISGFELETAGVLKFGRKIWALAKTNQSATLKGNDIVNGYVLLATACDGTLATTAQFTSIRVVCNNTLAVALANGSGAVKVPHSTSFNPEAEYIPKVI